VFHGEKKPSKGREYMMRNNEEKKMKLACM